MLKVVSLYRGQYTHMTFQSKADFVVYTRLMHVKERNHHLKAGPHVESFWGPMKLDEQFENAVKWYRSRKRNFLYIDKAVA